MFYLNAVIQTDVTHMWTRNWRESFSRLATTSAISLGQCSRPTVVSHIAIQMQELFTQRPI